MYSNKKWIVIAALVVVLGQQFFLGTTPSFGSDNGVVIIETTAPVTLPSTQFNYPIRFYIEMEGTLPQVYEGYGPAYWVSCTWNNKPRVIITFSTDPRTEQQTLIRPFSPGSATSFNWKAIQEYSLPANRAISIRAFNGSFSGVLSVCTHTHNAVCDYENVDATGSGVVAKIKIWYTPDITPPIVLNAPRITGRGPASLYYTNEGTAENPEVTIQWDEVIDQGTKPNSNATIGTISGLSKYFIYTKSNGIFASPIEIDAFTTQPPSTTPIANLNTTLNLEEGKYEISMKARDVAGNPENLDEIGYSPACVIIVDRTPPEVLTAAQSGLSLNNCAACLYANLIPVTLKCNKVPKDVIGNNQDISGVNSNHFYLFFKDRPDLNQEINGKSLESTPLMYPNNGPAIGNGTYSVAVRYYDNAGNINTSPIGEDEYYTFAIDTAKPSVPSGLKTETIDGKPLPVANGIYETYFNKVVLAWNPSTDGATGEDWQSGVAEYIIEKQVTINGIAEWQVQPETEETNMVLTLAKGDNRCRIRAKDNAGNISEPSAIITIKRYDILLPITFPKTPGEAVTYDANKVPTLHWIAPANAEQDIAVSYKVSILHDTELKKTSGDIPLMVTQYTVTGLATKLTYTAIVYAEDRTGRKSENSIRFTPGNIPVRIGPGGDYEVTGPLNNTQYPDAAALPAFSLTGTSPRRDSEGDIVLHKLYYKKQGATDYMQYPEADGAYTAEQISLEGLTKGIYEWYMEIAEFYDPGSGIPNKFETTQRWPVTTTVTLTFTIADNTLIDGRFSEVRKSTPGKILTFAATTYGNYSGDGYNYTWDFGDGSTTIGTIAEHPFYQTSDLAAVSTYETKLDVKDENNITLESIFIKVTVENTTRGMLYASEHWRGEHPLYGSVIVPAGMTLTIHSGTNVTVHGAGDTKLDIKGRLEVWGEDGNEVSIKSANASGNSAWQGVIITGSADISHLVIENAKRAITCVDLQAVVTIGSTTFRNNIVGLHSYNSNPVIGACRFENNEWYGIKEDKSAENKRPKVTGTVFHLNGYNYYHSELKNITINKLNEINGPAAGNSAE
jgi:hypothetical protein